MRVAVYFELATMLVACGLMAGRVQAQLQQPKVAFQDESRLGRPFAKDPSVVAFGGRYLMYYSLPPRPGNKKKGKFEGSGWGIGIAESRDLIHWKTVGTLQPEQPVEQDGIVAPGARVISGRVHLFYQSYGHGPKDAICHAESTDGIHFTHDPSNPIYHPTNMPWSVGRAIDADVFVDEKTGTAFLYFATRDPKMEQQMIGVAQADLKSGLGAGAWHDVSTAAPVLRPELPWEQLCIEAPSVMKRGNTFYMFYAGAYNNVPQQIGVARSVDGIHWTRMSDKPFLANGAPGSWNSSESGHPGILNVGEKTYLFFQGNNTKGHTYTISMVPIAWEGDTPVLGDPARLGK